MALGNILLAQGIYKQLGYFGQSSREDVLTVIERIETVFSVLSGDKDSSSKRKLSAFSNSLEVSFFLFFKVVSGSLRF